MNQAMTLRPEHGREQGKWISLALAIAMHLGLAIILIMGVHWQTEVPEAVEVQLYRAYPLPPAPAEITPARKSSPPTGAMPTCCGRLRWPRAHG